MRAERSDASYPTVYSLVQQLQELVVYALYRKPNKILHALAKRKEQKPSQVIQKLS